MPDLFQLAGAQGSPSDFAPLHVNRMVTGFWTNTNPLRDAATPAMVEKFYGGRQDRIAAGLNTEISSRLTLRRRAGTTIYNSQLFPAINRFYGWNTFTLNSETVRVMADCATQVFDATGPNTKTLIHTKAANAGPTFFLGVGNVLYMTNGVENLQLNNATGKVTVWGIAAPTTAPFVTQQIRPNPYPSWLPNTVFSAQGPGATAPVPYLLIVDSNGTVQMMIGAGTTNSTGEPHWNTTFPDRTTDGTVVWEGISSAAWYAGISTINFETIVSVNVNTTSGTAPMFFIATNNAVGGSSEPNWPPGIGSTVQDGGVIWQNLGLSRKWTDVGPSVALNAACQILDQNGYLETCIQSGKTSAQLVTFPTETGAYTTDNAATWRNDGGFSPAGTGPTQYGYAYMNSATVDISNMSPASVQTVLRLGNEVVIQGDGTGDPQADTVVLYRTGQGGSTFFQLATFPNPGAGKKWTYTDTLPDSALSPTLRAQVDGEGTPLPAGATCLEYHVGRIFAAVDNVVYVSSGPDAVLSGSSGNAGFDTTMTAQSKITRFWVNSVGVVVFTVRDAYIILGSGTDADPLYMVKYIDNLPLLHYDAFATYLTTPYLLTGHRMVSALDPSAGIVEASFPIADQIQQIDPAKGYVTFHNGPTGETALFVSDGSLQWYRMAPTSAPESGLNWNPPAIIATRFSAVQSVEVLPGTMALLIGPFVGLNPNSPNMGPILQRDPTVNTDNGAPFSAWADVGNIVLAHSGQLAGLAWITLESMGVGTATVLGVLLDEIEPQINPSTAPFILVPRTRQDPTNMPPIESYFSNRHNLLQGQKPVWCKSLCLHFYWPPEDAPNELLTYTIFGQTWAEHRSQ